MEAADLYRAHADELTAFATTMVGPSDAADAVSAAVVAALGAASWAQVENHRAYLYRCVYNECLRVTKRAAIRRDSRPHTFHDTYIEQVFEGDNLSPAFGNWVATHATYSDVIGTFGGGLPGQSLHGTNRPDLIGQAVTSGGIRVTDEAMQTIVDAPGGLLGASIVIHDGNERSRDFLVGTPWEPASTTEFDPENVPTPPVPSYS